MSLDNIALEVLRHQLDAFEQVRAILLHEARDPLEHGGGRVFVTVEPQGRMIDVIVEDDGESLILTAAAVPKEKERGPAKIGIHRNDKGNLPSPLPVPQVRESSSAITSRWE